MALFSAGNCNLHIGLDKVKGIRNMNTSLGTLVILLLISLFSGIRSTRLINLGLTGIISFVLELSF